jgi:thiamine pyrophosphate-dependent acetolactate synthase large subunit-like protein
MCGGKGYLVSTPEELARATEEGFKAGVPVVVNVIIESGKAQKLVRSNTVQTDVLGAGGEVPVGNVADIGLC